MGLYFYILGNCTISGRRRGQLAISIRDLSNDTQTSIATLQHHLKKLIGAKLITYIPAKNQHQTSVITITKHKMIKDFAVLKNRTAVVQQANSSSTAVVQHDTSQVRKETPNTYREGLKGFKKNTYGFSTENQKAFKCFQKPSNQGCYKSGPDPICIECAKNRKKWISAKS